MQQSIHKIGTLELTLLLTPPAAATLMIYSDSFLAVLFMAENFTLDHVKQTAPALVAYATGLPAYVVIKVLSASFFAHQDTKTPMYVAGVCFEYECSAFFDVSVYFERF